MLTYQEKEEDSHSDNQDMEESLSWYQTLLGLGTENTDIGRTTVQKGIFDAVFDSKTESLTKLLYFYAPLIYVPSCNHCI